MELARQLWGQISVCWPMQGGGCGGTVSLLAQVSSSMLSQGTAGRGQGTGSLPTVGTRGRGQEHARPLARRDVLKNQELHCLRKRLVY